MEYVIERHYASPQWLFWQKRYSKSESMVFIAVRTKCCPFCDQVAQCNQPVPRWLPAHPRSGTTLGLCVGFHCWQAGRSAVTVVRSAWIGGGGESASPHSCHHIALLKSPLGDDRAGWERGCIVPTGRVTFPFNY